jgi:hypothetical protein
VTVCARRSSTRGAGSVRRVGKLGVAALAVRVAAVRV